MNRLFRVLHRWKCKTAPQKLALDALRRLDGDGRWARLFLWHVESYLRGVDAPEAEFRDYGNHVIYPVGRWGGAGRLARKWYGRTVETLRTRDWNDAAFAAGVTTRYVGFAFSPLRTGHDENAATIRRPVEWCLSRLYDELIGEEGDAPTVAVPDGDDWLERIVAAAAEDAYCHLRPVTEKFDFEAVAKDPRALDGELRALFAKQLGRAAATAGAVLGRAAAEAGVEPPRHWLGPAGLLSLPSLPLFWVTRGRAWAADRRVVRAMHREFAATGRVEEALPDDARSIREAYEVEVLKRSPKRAGAAVKLVPRPADAGPAGAERGGQGRDARKPETAPAKPRGDGERTVRPAPPAKKADRAEAPGALTPGSPITAAAIDPKLVPRLQSAGVGQVADLLGADADDLAAALHPQATSLDVAAWQDQCRLRCAVGSLTPAEAQLLVACGVAGPDDLAALSPVELWELVIPVAESPDGRRLLGGANAPDLNAVTRWIDAANGGRRAA